MVKNQNNLNYIIIYELYYSFSVIYADFLITDHEDIFIKVLFSNTHKKDYIMEDILINIPDNIIKNVFGFHIAFKLTFIF